MIAFDRLQRPDVHQRVLLGLKETACLTLPLHQGRDSPTEVDSAGGTAHATIEEHFAASDWVLVSTRTQSAIAFNTRPLVFHDLESVPRSVSTQRVDGEFRLSLVASNQFAKACP